jgi:hypothetical protein
MSSLQLIIQNLALIQGHRIEEAVRLVGNAQHEQQQEDERNERMSQQNQNEFDWNESLSSFAMHYVPLGDGGSIGGESTSSASRDALIERWR